MITLNLIADSSSEELTYPMSFYVKKPLERFVYSRYLPQTAVPISYCESRPIVSKDIQLFNKTYVIDTNTEYKTSERIGWIQITGATYTSSYRDILVTNKAWTDKEGKFRPLFYKHILPEDTVSVSLYIVENGNKNRISDGYLVSLDDGCIYLNYKNHLDGPSGSYKLFWVVSVSEGGETTHTLLEPTPTVRLATWEDIDLDTGDLIGSVYTRDQVSGGWNYTFSQADTYYIKPLDNSLIQPFKPIGLSIDDPWFMRFTNGAFSAYVGSSVHSYSLPEWDLQPFTPAKPYVFSSSIELERITDRVVKAPRKHIAIAPDEGRHIEIRIYDFEDKLLKILTTDESLWGEQIFSEGVLLNYESGIRSWDNYGGFIELGINLLVSWQVEAAFYYESKDFEYTQLNLNPIENPDVLGKLVVFYLKPDIEVFSTALHYLLVEQGGKIVYTSDPDYQLYISSVFNPDTIIGKLYSSDVNTGTFLDEYAVGGSLELEWYVLAEVVVRDLSSPDLFKSVYIRRESGLKDSEREKVFAYNPAIQFSRFGYGEEGKSFPRDNVLVVKVPARLHQTYGGHLSDSDIREQLRQYLPAEKSVLIELQYPKCEVEIDTSVVAEVTITCTWEGPELTYYLYDITTEDILLDTNIEPVEGDVIFVEAETSGAVKTYRVDLEKDGILYKGNPFKVKVQ